MIVQKLQQLHTLMVQLTGNTQSDANALAFAIALG